MRTRSSPSATAAMLLVGLTVAGCASRGATPPSAPAPDGRSTEIDLGAWFDGVDPSDATFVVLDGRTGAFTRHNPERAARRFLPASTFKIANALVALETGVADGPDFALEWDGVRPEGGFWAEAWSRDHTLASAMAHSVYWFYQEVARRIGSARMQAHLDRLGYGNRDMGGGIDRFWLSGDLRISADEQVAFLRRIHRGEPGFSERSTAVLRGMLTLERGDGYRIFGKTGTVDVTPTRELAWLVGWVERGEEVSFFALNVEGEDVWDRWGHPGPRLDLVKSLLRETEVLPEGPA